MRGKFSERFIYLYYWISHLLDPSTLTLKGRDETVEFITPFRGMSSTIKHMYHSERAVIDDFMDEVRPGDVVYDVGAAYGLYTCLVASKDIQVVAFEPHPNRRARLRMNLRQNNLRAAVSIEPVALLEGRMSNWLQREHPTAEIVVGDEYVEQSGIKKPSIIKVDVEGGELDALRGLKQTISHPECRVIYCELHPDTEGRTSVGLSPQDLDDLRTLLAQTGFTVENVYLKEDHDDQPFLKATKE